MTQLIVQSRPTDPEEALRLAVEHAILAPSTYGPPEIQLRLPRSRADDSDRWFLHNRP